MKKLVLTIFFLALLAPSIVFAVEISDCKEGTVKCLCPPEIGVDNFPYNDQLDLSSTIRARYDCDSFCTDLSENNNIESWQLQCTVEDSGITTIASGSLVATTVASDAPDPNSPESEILPVPDLAVDIPGLEFTPGVKEEGTVTQNWIGEYVNAIYGWLIAAGAIIAIVLIMVAGLEWITAVGNETRIGNAKKRIGNALIGLVLILGAYSIAYLIDPNTVSFDTLAIQNIDKREWYPASEESLVMNYRTDISGETVPITGSHLRLSGQNNVLHPDAAVALKETSDNFYSVYTTKIVVSSATRDIQGQMQMFYKNCLKNGVCSVPTCNPAATSGLVEKVDGKYRLTGELTGVTDGNQIINTLLLKSNPANCAHTSTIAVDIWCDDGGSDFKHNVECQTNLIRKMTLDGWCKISSEAWHFEYDPLKVSSSCSTANNTISYTRNGTKYTPEANCRVWDFKRNFCTEYK